MSVVNVAVCLITKAEEAASLIEERESLLGLTVEEIPAGKSFQHEMQIDTSAPRVVIWALRLVSIVRVILR